MDGGGAALAPAALAICCATEVPSGCWDMLKKNCMFRTTFFGNVPEAI